MRGSSPLLPLLALSILWSWSLALPSPDKLSTPNPTIDGRPFSFEARLEDGLDEIARTVRIPREDLQVYSVEAIVPIHSTGNDNTTNQNGVPVPSDYRGLSLVAMDVNTGHYWETSTEYGNTWHPVEDIANPEISSCITFDWALGQARFLSLDQAWSLALGRPVPRLRPRWTTIAFLQREGEREPHFRFYLGSSKDVMVGARTGHVRRFVHDSGQSKAPVSTS